MIHILQDRPVIAPGFRTKSDEQNVPNSSRKQYLPHNRSLLPSLPFPNKNNETSKPVRNIQTTLPTNNAERFQER